MVKISVLIPFRGGSPWRDRHFELVFQHLSQLGWPITVADDFGSQPFSVSRSWNKAATEAGDWDVAVLNEADLYVPLDAIQQAVELAENRLVYAWDRLVGLTEGATERFYGGVRDFSGNDIQRSLPNKRGYIAPGGPRVVSRDLWEKVRGFDPRFLGWGGEDDAFAHTCRVMGEPELRVAATLMELWHPRMKDSSEAFFQRVDYNRRLYREIRAVRDPVQMQTYLDGLGR